jgi:hypothetical protein
MFVDGIFDAASRLRSIVNAGVVVDDVERINWKGKEIYVRECSPSPSGRTLLSSTGHRLTSCRSVA